MTIKRGGGIAAADSGYRNARRSWIFLLRGGDNEN